MCVCVCVCVCDCVCVCVCVCVCNEGVKSQLKKANDCVANRVNRSSGGRKYHSIIIIAILPVS